MSEMTQARRMLSQYFISILVACLIHSHFVLARACQCPSCTQSDVIQRCECCVYRQLGKRSGLITNPYTLHGSNMPTGLNNLRMEHKKPHEMYQMSFPKSFERSFENNDLTNENEKITSSSNPFDYLVSQNRLYNLFPQLMEMSKESHPIPKMFKARDHPKAYNWLAQVLEKSQGSRMTKEDQNDDYRAKWFDISKENAPVNLDLGNIA